MHDRYLRPDNDAGDLPSIPSQSRYALLWAAMRVCVILVIAGALIWFLLA